MTIHLNTHPDERKDMVKAISELTELDSTYMGMPSCAYQIGAVTVNRDGTINYDPDATTENLIPMLIEHDWLDPGEYDLGDEIEATAAAEDEEAPADGEAEETLESEEPTIPEPTADVTAVAITLPMDGWTVAEVKNLLRLVCSKQYLIRRMTGNETLDLRQDFVEALCAKTYHETIADVQADLNVGMERGEVNGLSFADDHFTMAFPYDEQNPTRWEAIGELLAGMMRMAKGATRVSLDSKATPENEKFYAHSWLMRMGYGGPEHKEFRATLLGHLKGYAAFKNEAAAQAHKDKYAAIRRERRENRSAGADSEAQATPAESEEGV